MFRALLTCPLIFAVAAGPLLCCCTAARLVAASPAAPRVAQQPVPAPAGNHSCCEPVREAPPVPDQTPAPDDHHDRDCPCKAGTAKVVAVELSAAAADASDPLRVLSLDAVTADPGFAAHAALGDGFHRHGDGPPRFPSAADLLFAHHKLRC